MSLGMDDTLEDIPTYHRKSLNIKDILNDVLRDILNDLLEYLNT